MVQLGIPTFLFTMLTRKNTLRTFLRMVHSPFLSGMIWCDWLRIAHVRVSRFQCAAFTQTQTLPHKTLFLHVFSNVAAKGSPLETDTKAMTFFCRCMERSYCGNHLSQSCRVDPNEPSPRSIWEGKAGSGASQGSSSQTAARHFTQMNWCPPIKNSMLWDETTKHLMRSLGKNDLRIIHVIVVV